MSWRRKIAEAFSRWIDRVEAAVLIGRESLRSTPSLRFIEGPDGAFRLDGTPDALGPSGWESEPIRVIGGRIDSAASANWAAKLRRVRVELVLQSHRFMFRPLELPRRAADFLEGIVRAQIDRLTPWSAAEAAFGWRPSKQDESERMIVTVAATGRSLIQPFASAFAAFGVDSIVVSASFADTAPIKVFEQKVEAEIDARRLRRMLIAPLAAGGALAAAAILAAVIVGGRLEDGRDELAQRVSERRAAMRSARDATDDATLALAQRKRETPSSVIVIEALSQILPDHTYLSELHVHGDKVQIIGLTRDAPSLIGLIEHSAHFAKAVFFAPTTRSLPNSGEHFSIEAKIEPVYTTSQ